MRIKVVGDLAAAVERMITRKPTATGATLIQDDAGQPLTYWMLEGRFDKARTKKYVKQRSGDRVTPLQRKRKL